MANPVLIAKLALVAADPKIWQKIISISKSDTTIIGSILCNSLSDPQFCGYSFLTNNRHAERADGENF